MKDHVESLFHEVADLSAEARTRYFAEHGVDEETRREVEALLAFDSGASTFIERDIGLAAGDALSQLEAKGSRCGPYRLLDLIGKGGMGAVYLAERVDGEVAQHVAVKLLRAGAGDPQRERFLQERQILATLSHPHIARLLDAGHLDDGQPFLAMEHVNGKPIDEHAAGLGLRQKIELFIKVCVAVGYMHRNLVVHRDLKPSNIFVTADGEPKLLDFGIAKILDLTTDSTMTVMRMLTPDYASPEQMRGGAISTATDIYSLGAVLYRLLTGKLPHELPDHSPEAVISAVTTREVTRPSKLAPALKGDLELILLKALRKDPQERYATAEQFADDLEAYLESRPVRARAGNAWYRARKFLRRYWVPVAATVFVIASLAAGLYVANRQRMIAERRFGQLRQLSNRIFDLDKAIRDLPGAADARHRLVSVSLEYLKGLGPDARGDVDLAHEIADAYMRLARVQGMPTELNLNEPAKADESLKMADTFIATVLASRPRSAGALHTAAQIAMDRMILAESDHRRDDAWAHARKAVERFDALVRLGTLSGLHRANAAVGYANLALAHINMHFYADGVRYARRTVELAHGYPTTGIQVSAGLSLIANGLRFQGDLEGALQAIQEALQAAEKAPYPNETSRMIDRYGIYLREGLILGEDGGINLDRPEEAAAAFQKAVDITAEAARKNPGDSASRGRMATATRELGKIVRRRDPARALALYDTAIRHLGEIKQNLKVRRDLAELLADSSYPLRRLRRADEARQRIDTAVSLLRENKDYPVAKIAPGRGVDYILQASADHYSETGQPDKAVEGYRDLLGKVQASNPDTQNDLRDAAHMSRLYADMAGILRSTSRTDEAAALDARRRDLWQHWGQKLPNNAFVRRQIAIPAN